MEKIHNLNSDTAGSMVFKFLLFQVPDCNTVNSCIAACYGYMGKRPEMQTVILGNWLLMLGNSLKSGK